MNNFFGDIASRFGLIPELIKQTAKTISSQATERRVSAELTETQKPALPPSKPEVTGGFQFFGDVAKKFNIPQKPEFFTEETQLKKTAEPPEPQRIAKETEQKYQTAIADKPQPITGGFQFFGDIARQFNLAKPQPFVTEETPIIKSSTALREAVKTKIGEPSAQAIIGTPEIRQERISKAAKILNIPEIILGGLATKTTRKEGEGLMEYLNRVPYLGDVVANKIKEKGLINDPKALTAISMAIGFVIPNIPGGEAAKKAKVAEEFLPTGKLEPLAQEAIPKSLSQLSKQTEGASFETFKRRLVSNIGSVDKGEKIPDDVADAVFKRLQATAQRGEFSDETKLFKDLGGRNPKRLSGKELATTYRAAPNKSLRPGDFVSFDKSEAGFYLSPTKKIFTHQIPKEDLVLMKGSVGGGQELIYLPKGHKVIEPIEYYKSARDFYNQGVKGVSKETTPAIVKPAVNIERLNIPQEAKQKIIKVSEEIKPQLEAVKGKVLSNDEVIEAAQKSEVLRKTTNRESTLKSEAALLRTRQHLAELAKNEKLTPEFIDTLKIVSEEATKRGRELQALGIEADPIRNTIKAKIVKQLLDIGFKTKEIMKASKGIDFNNAQQVMKFFREFVKPTLPEIIDEYRYINMLSSPRTQIVNTFSNILQTAILRPATRLASGVVDNIAHILTGKEQEFYIKQVPAYYKGALNSFGDALSEAMKVMKGQQQIYRPDIKSIPTGVKVFKPFQIIPRLMEASDVFFRKIASGGEIEALMSKGMKETEAISKAAKTAEELVFRKDLDPLNKTGQGVLLSKIDALTSAVYKLRDVPGIKWFIPFVQTPMNILKQGIEYSPLGITTLPGNINKIEQFGKTLVGTTVFAGAGWLALKDMTTWAVPKNQKEKDAFYAAGLQPYSIKIGDNWVSYSRLGPLAYPIAMAAAIKFYTKDNPKAVGDSEFQKITKTLSGIAQFFSDQSYVQGIGDFVDLAQGDLTALTRAASQIPSQLIPLSSLQRWVANIIDPIYRKTDKTLSVEGIIENLKKGIPGLTFGLPAYTTPEGEPSKRQYQFINPISPITISKEDSKWVDYLKTLQQVSRERTLETKSKEELKLTTQDLYDKMKMLPKEEAKRQFDDLRKNNPDLAKEVSNLAKEVKLDYKESFLKSLGVENKQRAKYIVEELNKLKTKEEKADYYKNLINKKVITKDVSKQILQLLGK